MNNLDIIQSSLDYIEENLKAEITAQELADKANFSMFYFYRLFQTAVGLPVMQYIVRRKLLYAIYEISCGNKIIDAALDYGFDTYAGFYKAFKREFGYTPKQFLKNHKVNKPYKINLLEGEYIMVTHKKISEILKNWNLESETITDIFYERGEKSENSFYVGDNYIIKVFVNLGCLNNHVNISKSLENLGLYTATPIKTAKGKEIVEDSQLYFILTERLRGKPIKAVNLYEGDYKIKGRFIGEIIGQLSLALEKVDAVVNDVNIYDSIKNWALPKVKETIGVPESLCKNIIEYFGNLYGNLPKQIIHRDPNPSNIIVAKDRWSFIDFNLSEKNIRVFDPCYAATAILSESFDENNREKLYKWIEIYKNIIYGFDSVAKLSDDEIKAIPYVILSIQLICCACFSEQEKYKNIFNVNKKMTKWICENFDKLMIE